MSKVNKEETNKIAMSYDELVHELGDKKGLSQEQKNTIIVWMGKAYEFGMKDARKLIGDKLGEAIKGDIK